MKELKFSFLTETVEEWPAVMQQALQEIMRREILFGMSAYYFQDLEDKKGFELVLTNPLGPYYPVNWDRCKKCGEYECSPGICEENK